MALGYNRVLGDERLPVEARPHRVAIAGWPTSVDEPRTRTLESLVAHITTAGYEGCEFGLVNLSRYYEGDSPAVVVRKGRRVIESAGLRVFGTALNFSDAQMRERDWLVTAAEQMKLAIDLGSKYVTYQLQIHPDHANCGGAYRDDERYLKWCADRISELRDTAWDEGLNFYHEVHVDRITEDPAALCRLLELATCELNGDMSHYLSRGFLRGGHVDKIMSYVAHSHVRMARKYGDLSAAVVDPQADWANCGVTWQMFQFMKPALAGGLSSRTICGETGPMHLVTDTLTQDAALVPLYRAMARFADASAQGIAIKVEDPGDLNPWA